MDAKKNFLKKHMGEIVQDIRNPIELADTLFAKKYINNEMYAKIRVNKTEQEKTREIYTFLKSEEQFACTYDWLKKNEVEVFKKLEKSDRETESPQKKRQRVENEDETDNTGFAEFKMICTFAKLEKWVSTPEIGEKLISDLERKLGNDGMEDLENGLKDKEPKNVLCFNAHNIDEIRKNKELAKFLSTTEATTIPKLTYSMFFKKGGSGSSENKNQSFSDVEEITDINADVSSSGYESLLSSTLNDGDEDNMTSGSKDKRSESKTTEQLHGQSVVPMDYEVKANGPSQEPMDMQDTYIDKEQCQTLNIVAHKEMTMHQNEQTTNKVTPLENGFARMEMQNTHIDQMNEELQKSNVPNFPRHEVYHCQNDKITKKETPLADEPKSTVMQGKHIDETDAEQKRLSVPRDEDVLQISSTKVSLKDGMESTDVQVADTDETNEKTQRLHFLNAQRDEDVFMDKNEKIQKSDKDVIMHQNDIHSDKTNDEPKRSSVPRNEDKLLYENKQIKEAPLEDRYESMDVQDTDIEDINDEPQQSNVFDVLPHGSIYLWQNEPITKMETPLENKLPTTDTKEIEEMNVQSQRSNALVHESVTMHLNESHTKNKTPLEDKLRSTVMQDTQNYEINDEQKRSSVPRNEEVLCQNELITNKDAPLEDEIENMDVQDADVEDMNDEPQRSNVPDVLTQRNIYLHHNNSTTKIETPMEDELRSTVMKYKHIDETNDGPKSSIVPRNKDVLLYQNEQIISKEPTLEDEFKKTDMQDADNNQINMKPQRVRFQNVPSHDNVSLNKNVKFPIKETPLENTRSNVPIDDVLLYQNEQITRNEARLEDELKSMDVHNVDIDDISEKPQIISTVPRDEDVLQISSTKASLKDGMESTDVQVADTDETNKKTQRLHFLNAQRYEDVFMDKNEKIQKSDKDVIMHQNESTTKIKTQLEDRFGRTVLQDAHIDGTHDEPKISNVPINKDVLLYENERIIKEGTQQQDRLGRINIKDTPIGEIDEESEKSNVPISEDVLLDQSEQITSKEALLKDGFKSTDVQDSDTDDTNDESQRAKGPHAPTFKSIYLGQKESITKTKKTLEDKRRSIAMQAKHTYETNDEPKRSSVPRNEDKLLYENKQINNKEAPLEDRYESMDVQDADIEDINDEPQRSNVFDVLPHGNIYLCQNEPITKMETPLENKLPTTDTKEIEEMNVQSQRSNALVHESVTMHLNESHTKNKTPLKDKLRSTVMQDTQNYEINDEHKRSSVPRNKEVLFQNELITNKDAPLEDEIENMDVQDADVKDMNDEPQRSNVPDVLTQRNIYLHHNNSTTKIETPMEDELRSTVMKYKHIDETNDGPKSSIVPRNKDVLLYQNEQIISKEPTLEDEFEKTDMQDADNNQINMKPQRVRFQNVPSHDNVSLNKNVKFPIKETPLENTRSNVPIDDVLLYQNEQITRNEARLEDELKSMDVHNVDIDDISEKLQIISTVPRDEDVLQISSTKASLKDGMESTDVQVADTDETNEKTQRLHFLNAQRYEDVFMDKNEKIQKSDKDVIMHQNESTTKIKTQLEDRFGRTVLQDAHIDGTHDEPKISNVPINKDVLLYENERIIKEGTQQQDRLGRINIKDTPIGEIDEESEKSNVPISEDVLLDQSEKITSKEALLKDGFKSTDVQESDTDDTNDESRRAKVPHAPPFKSIYLGQNESITKTKTPLEDKRRSIAMQAKHTDETNDEPKRSSVPRNEDKLLYENKQIKEAPLEDRYESMDVQDADIEDINDERSNVSDVLPHGSIYLCQNEPITKMETPLKNKLPTTDTKEIEEMNVQSQRSNALVHESVTMHLNESHTKNKTPLKDKLRSTVMQDTQNYEINDEHKRSSVPRNKEVLFQNELITNKDAPLEDEIENMDVQDADVKDMNDEPQRSNVPDVLTQRNIYLHHNNSTTKIETPMEDELRSTVMKYKHIDETNDGPKSSIVPRNEDVLLYQNEQIISKEPTLEDEFEKTDTQNADNDQINMKPQRVRFQNVPSHDNVSLNKNVKFPIKETPPENTKSNVPIDDVLLYQNEQIARKQAQLKVELESMDVHNVDIDDISEKPQIVCLTNDDVLLNQNEQVNDKEAPLEDEHESTVMQNADIEKMNDEPQRSNDSIVPTKGSIYLCQNEPIIKIGPTVENNPGRTDMKEIEQMNLQSQRSNVAVHESVTMHRNESPTKNKTPLEDKLGRTVRQNTHINKADVPKRSIVPGYKDEFLYENKQITSKEAPLKDELKSMVVQDADIDNIRENPQKLCSTNAPQNDDVFLDNNETFSQKQPPLENGGSRNIYEIVEEPQRSSVANIPIYGDTFLHQNDQLTNKVTPVVNKSGSIEKKEMLIDKMDEEPLRSNVPMFTACQPQTESIINSKMPLPDRCENVNMQPSKPTVTLVNPEPRFSKPLQQNNPGPALENTQRIESEFWAENRATATQARNNDLKRRSESIKRREKSKQQRQKKKKEMDKLIYNWAKSQCNDHEKPENLLEKISIINMAEHNEYSCFTAENVMVYKYLTPESKILFTTDDNTSINTMTIVHYQMFVCDIKKAVILGPKKPKTQEIPYNKSLVPIIKCKNFIFQAFAPALVVYKKIQKEKHLCSLSECSQ